jgi:hypothetical protein
MSGIFALSLFIAFIANPIFSGIFVLSLFIASVRSKVELIVSMIFSPLSQPADWGSREYVSAMTPLRTNAKLSSPD